MTDYIPAERPFTGRKMTLVIVAFFGVIIAVNGLMLTLALKNFGGLVVGNSYVASQNFNEDIAAARAQPIRAWKLNLSSDAGSVALQVAGADGAALSGLDLSITLDRPAHNRSTSHLTLTEREPGLYAAPISLEPGRWSATVETADGQARSLNFIHAGPES